MHRVHGGARVRRVPSTPSLRHAAGVALAAYRKAQGRQEARESSARRLRRQYARLLMPALRELTDRDPFSYTSPASSSGATFTPDTTTDIASGVLIAPSVITGITITTYPSVGPTIILAERVYQDLVTELDELRARVVLLERELAARRNPPIVPVAAIPRRSFALEDP